MTRPTNPAPASPSASTGKPRWFRPTVSTWIVGAIVALFLVIAVATSGLSGLLIILGIALLPTAIYVMVTGRRSWASIPSRNFGKVALAASIAVMVIGSAIGGATEPEPVVAEAPLDVEVAASESTTEPTTTASPTPSPSPSAIPSATPSASPSPVASAAPSKAPVAAPAPTKAATPPKASTPTKAPSKAPTKAPTKAPVAATPPKAAAPVAPAVTAAPAPAPAAPAPAPAPAPVVVAPVPQAPANGKLYQNCDAAKAAGAAPVRLGDPGYGKHLDRDGDGIGCE